MALPSRSLLGLAAACAASVLCVSGPARAQGSEITPSDYLASLRSMADSLPPRRVGTASTVGLPSGFTLPRGTGFAALALSDRRERTGSENLDGSGALGLGFGDAEETVGVDVILGFSSVGKGEGNEIDWDDFGDSGSVSIKFARRIPAPFEGEVASVAVGVDRAGRWGDMEEADPSYYAAGTTTFSLPVNDDILLPGLMTLGYATEIGTSEDEDGLFFGLGLGVSDHLSLGASWYGDEVIAGVTSTFEVSDRLDLQLGLSYGDVGQRNSDGRWMLSIAVVRADIF
ncbi:hypothetical protein SAMN04487993_101639 [Salipiger marinus]|uniref:MetA-pathway of phenol degradation n=1 Tax=Salipiger marinus TaxID=555512 RepID=A0A1G8QK36_9RHOB|nr:hypothetical protein SAMN04487993_101639 [Salipiger marinus]